MKKKCGFTKAERLSRNREFRRIFREGKSFSNQNLIIYIYKRSPEEDGQVRLGLVVSRKLGEAVKRNKLKRRLREIFRLHKHLLKPGLDMIFLPRNQAINCNYQELEKSVLSIFKRAKLFCNTNPVNGILRDE
ncbi:MAG TPA: ribonuclease P protein component [Elusimicrobia bacterium]|nr:ribonuclease P protein component [Elusimicrobiota bacterium]